MKNYKKFILVAITYMFLFMLPIIINIGEYQDAYIVNINHIFIGFIIMIIPTIFGIFIGYYFNKEKNN